MRVNKEGQEEQMKMVGPLVTTGKTTHMATNEMTNEVTDKVTDEVSNEEVK